MNDNPLSSNAPASQLVPPNQAPPQAAEEQSEVASQAAAHHSPGALSDPHLDEAAKHEFLWHTHEYLSEYARFADTKAAFAGAIASALIGALYSAKAHVSLFLPLHQWSVAAWLTVVASTFLAASILLAVWTVLPRLGSTQSKGFVYWGAIANHRSVELLQTSFHSQSPRTLNDHLLHHLLDISQKVSIPKYRAATLCIWTMVIGGFLTGAALVVADIPVPPVAPIQAPASAK
jgi:hypothetical protein